MHACRGNWRTCRGAKSTLAHTHHNKGIRAQTLRGIAHFVARIHIWRRIFVRINQWNMRMYACVSVHTLAERWAGKREPTNYCTRSDLGLGYIQHLRTIYIFMYTAYMCACVSVCVRVCICASRGKDTRVLRNDCRVDELD